MISQEAILDVAKTHFPFDTPNPGQMTCIVEACDVILNDKAKHVIIEAPTGIGKSVIATTIHNTIREFIEGYRSTIITTSKSLQDQYSSDVSIYDLRGKNNYSCPVNAGPYNSNSCRSAVRSGCKPKADCPYVTRREYWCDSAPLRMTNHSFQIEACDMLVIDNGRKSNLIVIDECHDVDDNIIAHTTIDLNLADYASLKELGKEQIIDSLTSLIDLFSQTIKGIDFTPTKSQVAKMNTFGSIVSDTLEWCENKLKMCSAKEENLLNSSIEALQSIKDKTGIFNNKSKWIINEYENSNKVVLKPVFASAVAEYALFRKANHFVHMSATICGIETYAETLGLEASDVYVIQVPNPIPIKQRKIFAVCNHRVSGKFSDYKGLAATIDKMIERHENQSGIIHTVSFKLAQDILQNSKHSKRMIVSGKHDEILRHLSKRGGIVLSPSIEKGFDAKGDLARFQIIPKIPFGYLGDPLVKLNSEINPEWYSRKTILRLVQACGRAVRGVDDHAVTYILDSNFGMLRDRSEHLFPSWFIDAIK